MTVEGHLAALEAKHVELEKRLEQEQARPMPDDDVIRTLKHEKLAIRDEISGLKVGD